MSEKLCNSDEIYLNLESTSIIAWLSGSVVPPPLCYNVPLPLPWRVASVCAETLLSLSLPRHPHACCIPGKPRAMSSVPAAATDSPTRLTSASQRSQSLALPTASSATVPPATPRIKRNSSNVSFASASAQSVSSMELGGKSAAPS